MKKCVISKCKEGDIQEGMYLKRSSVAEKSSKMKVTQSIGFENYVMRNFAKIMFSKDMQINERQLAEKVTRSEKQL